MATPHLKYRAKDASLDEDVNPLLRSDEATPHLLIINRASAWSNKTFVVPPDNEHYACAVDYGISSLYNSDYPYSDSVTMCNRHEATWNGMDDTSWKNGHKPVFQYYARGFGPWWVRIAPSNADPNTCIKILEYGGTREQLHFNCRSVPTFFGAFDSNASFRAYLRLWNPSILACRGMSGGYPASDWPDYEDALYSESVVNGMRFPCRGQTKGTGTWKSERLWYSFFDSIENLGPNALFANSAQNIDLLNKANEGNSGGGNVVALRYDPWNIHHYSSAPTTMQRCVAVGIYAKGTYYATVNPTGFSTASYYCDCEITGTQLDRLRKSIRDTGGAWMQVGFRPTVISTSPGTDPTLVAGYTETCYVARIDLVLVISGSRYVL